MSERRQGSVGAAVSPREARKLVLGRGSYTGDLTALTILRAVLGLNLLGDGLHDVLDPQTAT